MAEIFRPPYFQVESAAGVPLSGAKLYFYVAGTTTDQAVYQEIGLSTQHTQPVVADASGIFPAIYLGASTYKAVLKTAADVEIKSYDNINATSAGSTVLDGTFRIQNTSDATKQIAFSAAAITAGTTRTFTFPDTSGTVLTTGNTATDALALGATSNSSVLSPSNLQQERQLGTQTVNLGLAASVAASALTISLKGKDGSDPSATNPVTIPFRNVTAATGTPTFLTVTAATSVVISSGSTLGMTSAVAATLAIVGFNDAGTFRLGLINPVTHPLNDGIASSTAEGGAGAADSAGVIYTGTAVTSKAMTVLGYATVTEATAGTWATAPATLQLAGAAEVNNAISIPGMEYVASIAASASSTINFDSSTGVTFEANHDYIIKCTAVKPSADCNIQLRYGTGATPTYQATGYTNQTFLAQTTTIAGARDGITTALYISHSSLGGASADETFTCNLIIDEPAANALHLMRNDYVGVGNDGLILAGFTGGKRSTAEVLTGLQVFPSTGSFTTGTFTLYRRRIR